MIKTCKNCVMDETDVKITFNQEGICDHCLTFFKDIRPNWDESSKGKDQLEKVLRKIKKHGEGQDFDSILGLSGGYDSSYMAHVAVKEFGLKPLIFHVDGGWNTETAVHNIEALVTKLKLDLFTEVINWKEMSNLQLSFFKSGLPGIDAPQDHAFFATMYNFAEKYNIKFILSGANYSTECVRNPMEWMYYQSDSRLLKDVQKKFGSMALETFPLTNAFKHRFYLKYFKGIKLITPLNYVPYKKESAKQLLVSEYGWKPYAQKHFESRFTRFFEGYWLLKRFGYDTRKVQFSSLILTNQMTRDEALEKLKEDPYDYETLNNDKEFISSKLGITIEDLEEYFLLPKKTFSDYKNAYPIYFLGAYASRLLGIERGGKR